MIESPVDRKIQSNAERHLDRSCVLLGERSRHHQHRLHMLARYRRKSAADAQQEMDGIARRKLHARSTPLSPYTLGISLLGQRPISWIRLQSKSETSGSRQLPAVGLARRPVYAPACLPALARAVRGRDPSASALVA